MWQGALKGSSGGGEIQELTSSTAVMGSSWNTGYKITDVDYFLVTSDVQPRTVFARNNNGAIDVISNHNTGDTSVGLDASGYIHFNCSNSAVATKGALFYGLKA